MHNKSLLFKVSMFFFKKSPLKNPAKLAPKKIAILKVGALGDVVMTTPFLEALRSRFPEATIHYYLGKEFSAPLKYNKSIDKVIPFDSSIMYKKNIWELYQFSKNIRKEKYDLGIVLDKSYLSGLFLTICKPKYCAGFDRSEEGFMHDIKIPYNNNDHEVDQYLKLAYVLGAKKIKQPKCTVEISKEDETKVLSFLNKGNISKFICVLPGGAQNSGITTDQHRRLPERKWIETISDLQKNHIVIIHGGPTDVERNNEIVRGLNNKKNIVNTTGKFNILESTSLFRYAEIVVCNDSGPMHLAGAVCNKMVCLFGSTNPKRKAPRYINCVSIWKKEDQRNYQPNFEYFGTQPDGKFMQTISAREIISAVRFLEKIK